MRPEKRRLLRNRRRQDMNETVGYCGQTDGGGDCVKGHLGAWGGAATRNLQTCLSKCNDCVRCSYISFSKEWSDCSWYSACDMTLTEIPGQRPGAGRAFTTYRVKDAAAPPAGKACRRHLDLPMRRETLQPTCMSGLDQAQPVVVVTSTSTWSWAEADELGFAGTVLEKPLGAPVWVYHEHSFDLERGRTSPQAIPRAPSHRHDVCLLDLFSVMPIAPLVVADTSCIDAFYRIAGTHEPIEYSIKTPGAKLLFRSVAALYHAAVTLPRGSALLWADWDAVPIQPLTSHFWDFVRSYDVTYVPYVDVPHVPGIIWRADRMGGKARRPSIRLKELTDPEWRVWTPVIGFSPNARSRALLEAMLAHYDGDGAWVTRRCLCEGGSVHRLPCATEWFGENLYFDPQYAWSLHLHWAAHSPPHRALVGLRQGWFGADNHRKHGGAGNLYYAADDCLLYRYINFQAACPAAAPHISQFDIFEYFDHIRFDGNATLDSRKGPFGSRYSHWSSAKLPDWPELKLPDSSHGGWMHSRIAERNKSLALGQPLPALEAELSGCSSKIPTPKWW